MLINYGDIGEEKINNEKINSVKIPETSNNHREQTKIVDEKSGQRYPQNLVQIKESNEDRYQHHAEI